MYNFIRRYDDIIPPEKCQYFIDKFEANPEIHLVQDNSITDQREVLRPHGGFGQRFIAESSEKYYPIDTSGNMAV